MSELFSKHKPRESHPFDDFTLVCASLCLQKNPTKQTKKPQASNKKIKIKNQPTSNIKVRKVLAAFEKNPPQIEKHLINLLRGTQAKQLETGDSRIAVHNPRSYFHTFLKNS